jgi:hypothetical protein
MSKFSGPSAVDVGFVLTVNEDTPTAQLGQMIGGDDGRRYVYAKSGSALVAGTLYQTAAEVTANENLAVTATAIGATSVTTTTTVTVTKNQYQGGYLTVTTSAGAGIMYRILSHQAATSAVVTLVLEDPITVALTTGSRIDLTPNPYNGVIVQSVSGSLTGATAGAAVCAVTSGNYCYLQVAGPGVLLNDAAGALTVGQDLIPSASVAGSVRLATAGIPSVGTASEGAAASEFFNAFLNIA